MQVCVFQDYLDNQSYMSIPKPGRQRVFVVFVGVVGRAERPWQKQLFAVEACSELPLSLWRAGNHLTLSPWWRLIQKLCSLSQQYGIDPKLVK